MSQPQMSDKGGTVEVVSFHKTDDPNSPFVNITVHKGRQPVTPLPDRFAIICPECNGVTMVNRDEVKCKHCNWQLDETKEE